MAAQKLTQQRVHEIIEQYAAVHDGQIPSTTDIIVLNDGHGSPSSANAYRKTYLALKLKPTTSTPKDPMAGFPEAIADAVKAMESSVQAKAQQEIEAMKVDIEKREADWQEKLGNTDKALNQLQSEKEEVEDSLKLKQFEADTLREEIKEQESEIQSLVMNTQKLEGAVHEARAHYDALKIKLDALPPAVESQTEAITGMRDQLKETDTAQQARMIVLQRLVETLSDDVQRAEDSQQRLIQANTELSDAIAKQAEQYQGEIDRLNQLVDDLRQAEKKTAQQAMETTNSKIKQLTDNSGAIISRFEGLEQILEALNAQSLSIVDQISKTGQPKSKDPSK